MAHESGYNLSMVYIANVNIIGGEDLSQLKIYQVGDILFSD